ncbi:MAG TPA: hypothetical protein PKL10_15815 [Nitrospira sp.]|nr:hypothetical protein [Nitrospira sp.]
MTEFGKAYEFQALPFPIPDDMREKLIDLGNEAIKARKALEKAHLAAMADNPSEYTRPETIDDEGPARKEETSNMAVGNVQIGNDVVPSIGAIALNKIRSDSALQPATIPCMCCRRMFKSWDRMRNRICRRCKLYNDNINVKEASLCL